MNTLETINGIVNNSIKAISTSLSKADHKYLNLELSLLPKVTEVTSVIYTTCQLTDLTIDLIDDKLLRKYDLSYKQLMKIETSLTERLHNKEV